MLGVTRLNLKDRQRQRNTEKQRRRNRDRDRDIHVYRETDTYKNIETMGHRDKNREKKDTKRQKDQFIYLNTFKRQGGMMTKISICLILPLTAYPNHIGLASLNIVTQV